MGMLTIKEDCNRKYAEMLESLRNGEGTDKIHKDLVGLAEALVDMAKAYPSEAAKCKSKAAYLIKIASKITRDSDPADVYFELTGSRLNRNVRADDLRKELNGLKKNSDKTKSENIARITDIPKHGGSGDGIRPATLDDYVGQDRVKKQIGEAITAAKIKGKPLEHVLLFGSAGLGKTSLAKIIATEMGSRIIVMSGPTIKDAASLVSVIKDVRRGDIVFIDEIHRINPAAAESIYTVMEDFELSYIEKDKDETRNVTLKLPPFTVIGATTHSGLLEKPMRDRFPIQLKMEPYNESDLTTIATASMLKSGKQIDRDAAAAVAKRSRGVPRICNGFIKRLYDRALVSGADVIDLPFTETFFDDAGIDENGLTETDLAYLRTIYEKFGNKPVGIDNLASCLGEGKNIIESQIEPYLLYSGLIQITPSGRLLTVKGLEYIAKKSE